jgi:hypothetical protein
LELKQAFGARKAGRFHVGAVNLVVWVLLLSVHGSRHLLQWLELYFLGLFLRTSLNKLLADPSLLVASFRLLKPLVPRRALYRTSLTPRLWITSFSKFNRHKPAAGKIYPRLEDSIRSPANLVPHSKIYFLPVSKPT